MTYPDEGAENELPNDAEGTLCTYCQIAAYFFQGNFSFNVIIDCPFEVLFSWGLQGLVMLLLLIKYS